MRSAFGLLISIASLLAVSPVHSSEGQGTADGKQQTGEGSRPVMEQGGEQGSEFECIFSLPTSSCELHTRSWYLKTEGSFFYRHRVDDRTFVVDPPPSNRPLLRTSDWSNPLEISGRFLLGYQLSGRTALELIGWFEDDFSNDTAIRQSRTPTPIRQPFFNHTSYPGPPVIGNSPTLVELAYQSQIISVELNLQHWCQPDDGRRLRTGVLFGPRFFSLEEQFQDFDSSDPSEVRGANPTDSVYQTFTSNHMYGGQLGGLIELKVHRRTKLISETKWSGFVNVTRAENRFGLQDGSFEFFRASTPERRFSGLVELALHLVWKQSSAMEIWAGYRAMYFWNMTSAPDVLSFDLLNQSKQNNELAFWVHGPTAGVLLQF